MVAVVLVVAGCERDGVSGWRDMEEKVGWR